MYCIKCGAELPENSSFCQMCGQPVKSGGAPTVAPAPVKPVVASAKKKKHLPLIGLFLAAALIGICIFAFSGRSADKVVKQYVKASLEADAKTIVNLLPKEMKELMLEEAKDDLYLEGEDEVIEYLNEMLQYYVDYIDTEMGNGWKYTYKIVEEMDYDKSEVAELNREYRSEGMEGFKASAAKEVEVEITLKSKDGETETETLYVTLVKIGRKWYLGSM